MTKTISAVMIYIADSLRQKHAPSKKVNHHPGGGDGDN